MEFACEQCECVLCNDVVHAEADLGVDAQLVLRLDSQFVRAESKSNGLRSCLLRWLALIIGCLVSVAPKWRR